MCVVGGELPEGYADQGCGRDRGWEGGKRGEDIERRVVVILFVSLGFLGGQGRCWQVCRRGCRCVARGGVGLGLGLEEGMGRGTVDWVFHCGECSVWLG